MCVKEYDCLRTLKGDYLSEWPHTGLVVERIGLQLCLACHIRRLNSAQNPGWGHRATTMRASDGGMGYLWHATCWSHWATTLKTLPQTVVVQHAGKDATFLAV